MPDLPAALAAIRKRPDEARSGLRLVVRPGAALQAEQLGFRAGPLRVDGVEHDGVLLPTGRAPGSGRRRGRGRVAAGEPAGAGDRHRALVGGRTRWVAPAGSGGGWG